MRTMKKLLPLLLVLLLLLTAAAPVFAESSGKATVTVKYVTGDKNKTIAKNRTITGTPGKHFSVKVRDIAGYTFIGFSDDHPNDFVFPKNKMTVLVHYAKGAAATVKYLDTYGNTIYPSVKLTGIPGAVYTINTPSIQGYVLSQVQDPNHGVFSSKGNTVKVIYTPTGIPTPAPTTQVRLTVQSVEIGSGAVLKNITNQAVMLPATINLSNYNHQVPGYSYYTTLVNGVTPSSNLVSLHGDTTVSFVYSGNIPTPPPVVKDATLYVYAIDEDTGDILSTIYSGNMRQGSSFRLSPPSFNGYAYDYTEVNGGPDWSSSITVNYDTVVVYYYNMLYMRDVPVAVDPTPDPYDPDIPVAPSSLDNDDDDAWLASLSDDDWSAIAGALVDGWEY